MAILNEGAGSTQMGSATTPIQPVQSVSPLDSLASTAGNALSVMSSGLQAQAQADRAQAILDKDAKKEAGEVQDTDLGLRLAKINVAFEQHGDSKLAKEESRKVLVEFMSDPANKARGDELLGTYSKFMSTSGLGGEYFVETQEDKILNARITAAAKDGVIMYPNDSDEVRMQKLDNHARYVAAGAALERSTKILSEANAKLEQKGKLTANEMSELNLKIKKEEIARSESLTSMADSYSTIIQDKFKAVRDDYDLNKDQGAAELAIEQAFFDVKTLISQAAGTGNSAQVTAMTAPMVNLYNANIRYVKGLATLEELQTARKTEDLRMVALMFEKNPEIQQRIAFSNLISNTDPGLTSEIGADVIKYIDGNLMAKPINLTDMDKKVQKAIVNVGLSFIEDDLAGRAGPEAKKEGTAYLTKLFNDFDKYAASVDNPQQLNELVTLLADPRFGEWVGANKGVPASISVAVKDTLKAYYSEPVLKDVVQNWEKGVAVDQRTFGSNIGNALTGNISENRFNNPSQNLMPMSEILEPVMTESGLSFRGKEGVSSALVTPALKQANRDVLPKINKLVKAMAHIEGSTDYNKYFEANYANILGVAPEEAPKAPKVKEPLASEQFVPKTDGPVQVGDVVAGLQYKGGDLTASSSWGEPTDMTPKAEEPVQKAEVSGVEGEIQKGQQVQDDEGNIYTYNGGDPSLVSSYTRQE